MFSRKCFLTLAIKFADFTVVFLGFLINGNSAESWERGEKKHLLLASFFPSCVCVCYMLSRVFVTPWTGAHRLLCPWNSPDKNTGVGESESHSVSV